MSSNSVPKKLKQRLKISDFWCRQLKINYPKDIHSVLAKFLRLYHSTFSRDFCGKNCTFESQFHVISPSINSNGRYESMRLSEPLFENDISYIKFDIVTHQHAMIVGIVSQNVKKSSFEINPWVERDPWEESYGICNFSDTHVPTTK